jgi:hypothetical protein
VQHNQVASPFRRIAAASRHPLQPTPLLRMPYDG